MEEIVYCLTGWGGCETQVACAGLFTACVKNALCQMRSTCVWELR